MFILYANLMSVLPHSSMKSKRQVVMKTDRQNTCPQAALNNGHIHTVAIIITVNG
jgi:hypothetical protein